MTKFDWSDLNSTDPAKHSAPGTDGGFDFSKFTDLIDQFTKGQQLGPIGYPGEGPAAGDADATGTA